MVLVVAAFVVIQGFDPRLLVPHRWNVFRSRFTWNHWVGALHRSSDDSDQLGLMYQAVEFHSSLTPVAHVFPAPAGAVVPAFGMTA